MSYFDDNQDRIIYGPRPSELLRRITPRAYYTKEEIEKRQRKQN